MSLWELNVVLLWVIVILLGAVVARLLSIVSNLRGPDSTTADIQLREELGPAKRAIVFIGSDCPTCERHGRALAELGQLGAEIIADAPTSLVEGARVDTDLFHQYHVPGTPFAVVVGATGTRRIALGSARLFENLKDYLVHSPILGPTQETV